MAALTKKQKAFVEEYLIDLNATQAAIRAGYSVNSAKEIGCENLTKPNIQEAVGKAMAERSKRTGINQDRVLMELAKLAFVNIDDVVDLKTGRVKKEATKDDLACIQSVKIKPTEYGDEREVKFYDKKGSLEQLGRHLGLWNDKIELNTDMELNINIDYGDESGDG